MVWQSADLFRKRNLEDFCHFGNLWERRRLPDKVGIGTHWSRGKASWGGVAISEWEMKGDYSVLGHAAWKLCTASTPPRLVGAAKSCFSAARFRARCLPKNRLRNGMDLVNISSVGGGVCTDGHRMGKSLSRGGGVTGLILQEKKERGTIHESGKISENEDRRT